MTQLYLYLLAPKHRNFPNYKSAIVVASNEDEARKIHPNGSVLRYNYINNYWTWDNYPDYDWPAPFEIDVVKLGIADNPSYKEGDVLCKERS